MNCSELSSSFANLPNPVDYFQGLGENFFSPPRNILFFYRNKIDATELQLHTDFHYRNLLVLNTGDPVRIQLDGRLIYLDRQSFILIFPYQYHRFMVEKEEGLSLIFMSFEMSDSLYLESFRYMPKSFDENTMDLVNSSLEAFKSGDIMNLPFQAGALLADFANKDKIITDERFDRMKSSRLVSELCRRIYKNKSTNIKELSHKLGYSESYLRKSFRKVMGIALGQYIIEVRLTAAMYYLSTSERSVSEITELVGYDSIYSLSRAFKVHVGLSPSAYRQERMQHFKSQEVYRFRNKKNRNPDRTAMKHSSFHFFSSDRSFE